MTKRYAVQATRGELDWSRAELLTDFSFPWEATPAPNTEFRALWDEERLHFRFDCVDLDMVLGAGPTAKERVLGSDRVELFFAPGLELNPYFCVEMAPNGDVYGYRAQTYRKFDDDFAWQGLELSTRVDGTRYTVSGSLPLATLRSLGVLKAEARELLVGVYRAEFSHEPAGGVHFGWMSWVDPRTETPDFHVPSSFGVFELLASTR
jgi:Carbohydrate family 9 binding domain-like